MSTQINIQASGISDDMSLRVSANTKTTHTVTTGMVLDSKTQEAVVELATPETSNVAGVTNSEIKKMVDVGIESNGTQMADVQAADDGGFHEAQVQQAHGRSDINKVLNEAQDYADAREGDAAGHDPKLEADANRLADKMLKKHGRSDGDVNMDVRSGSHQGQQFWVEVDDTKGGDVTATVVLDENGDQAISAGDVYVTQTRDTKGNITTTTGHFEAQKDAQGKDTGKLTSVVDATDTEKNTLLSFGSHEQLLKRAQEFTAYHNPVPTAQPEGVDAKTLDKGEEVFKGAGTAIDKLKAMKKAADLGPTPPGI